MSWRGKKKRKPNPDSLVHPDQSLYIRWQNKNLYFEQLPQQGRCRRRAECKRWEQNCGVTGRQLSQASDGARADNCDSKGYSVHVFPQGRGLREQCTFLPLHGSKSGSSVVAVITNFLSNHDAHRSKQFQVISSKAGSVSPFLRYSKIRMHAYPEDSPILAMCSAFFTSCSARVLKRFEVYLYILWWSKLINQQTQQ